jgi:hypothetical protein
MKKLPKVPGKTKPTTAFAIAQRALREGLGLRLFGKTEIQHVLDFFGSETCVFCGSPDVERWDHLISIKKGGETVLGNMVLSCQKCDDSKCDKDFATWMVSDVENSPKTRGVIDIEKRIERIRSYMQHYGYVPRMLEDCLTEQETQELAKIMTNLVEIREAMEDLIAVYRNRMNGE